jgi:hypothetical protein
VTTAAARRELLRMDIASPFVGSAGNAAAAGG